MNRTPRPFELPTRQIHLDFHNSPWIPDVGVEFDARAFARAMREARVNSVTVFAKCHHGHLYYNTRRPERHPGLKPGLNLLGEQVEALHREGIRAPVYVSVLCDEHAADAHPEWVARQEDGRPVGAGPLSAGWQVMDMASPYQEYLVEQTREVLRLFRPVDGLFFDMCWDQPSLNHHFVEKMLAAGLNPERESDRKAYAHTVALDYMARLHAMVKESSPRGTVFFNSRLLSNLHEEIRYQEQVEIESLPTGGWGYLYFPRNARFARTFPRPYLGMTARFHKGWADFGGLKPYAALEYETSQMIAHGASCSIGDQLHPRGALDPAAYELIGRVYARVEEREPWLAGAKSVSQIGLFQLAGAAHRTNHVVGGSEEGATRLLTQLKAQFDVVTPASDLSRYDLLILPDYLAVTGPLAGKLAEHLARGGAVLATGASGLSADGREVLLPELGVAAGGMSPFQTTYIRFGPEVAADVPATDHVMYERGVRVTAAPGTAVLARVVEPYFERGWRHFSSHCQTPPDALSRYAAATLNAPAPGAPSGGKAAYVAYPLFAAFAQHGNWPYRLLVRNLLEKLLPEPLLRVGAPTSTEATVMRQEADQRTIVHLLQYCPERRTKTLDLVEEVVPLYDVPVSLRCDRPPGRVYVAPEKIELPFEHRRGRVLVTVPEVWGHAMVVFEDAAGAQTRVG